MDSERWQHIERLYHSVLEKKVNERAAFLDQACAGDEGLRREVESLLSYAGAAADFIETPALEVAAKEAIKLRVKTIRHSDCVEVGKDHFDEVVTKFLEKIGETHLVSITPIIESVSMLCAKMP